MENKEVERILLESNVWHPSIRGYKVTTVQQTIDCQLTIDEINVLQVCKERDR